MFKQRIGRKVAVLVGMILLAILYLGLLAYQGTITGTNKWDGALGVMLGLYICSHPAANLLDLILFRRLVWPPEASPWSIAGWVVFNLLIVGMGYMVILTGMLHFTTT
jgi:hypothetical protein